MTLPEDTPPDRHFDEEHHPRQRASDQGARYWSGWVYRHLVPAFAVAIAALAVHNTQGKVDRVELLTTQQAAGRAIAIDVLCGFSNGVADAGRKALSGRLKGMNPRRGLPPDAQADYVATISRELLNEAGVTASNVLRADGQIDCAKLRKAAKATHP